MMKIFSKIFITFLLLFNIAFSLPKDFILLESVYTILHIIDWNQTLQISSNPYYFELNPLLGKKPSKGKINFYFSITLFSNYLIGYFLYKKNKSFYYLYKGILIGIEGTTTFWNYRIGLKFKF